MSGQDVPTWAIVIWAVFMLSALIWESRGHSTTFRVIEGGRNEMSKVTITIDGAEGAGKSTCMRILAIALADYGARIECFEGTDKVYVVPSASPNRELSGIRVSIVTRQES